MTMEEILSAKALPEDVKFLTSLIRAMAREIIVLRAAINKLEAK
jgi:hypothetical protein